MKMSFQFIIRQVIAALVGGVSGLAVLSVLMLPHEWRPMGRWDTFKVFSLVLSCWHFVIWMLVLIPLSLVIKKFGSRLGLLQAILAGGGAYGAAVIVTQMCFDHLGSDTLWFLVLAFIVGGITQLTYVALEEKVNSTSQTKHGEDPGAKE